MNKYGEKIAHGNTLLRESVENTPTTAQLQVTQCCTNSDGPASASGFFQR